MNNEKLLVVEMDGSIIVIDFSEKDAWKAETKMCHLVFGFEASASTSSFKFISVFVFLEPSLLPKMPSSFFQFN